MKSWSAWWSRAIEEPYRIFFPLGIFWGFFGAGHWLFYTLGWSPEYSGIAHAGIQMQGYVLCFVIGFLLTSVPRFASAPHASQAEVIGIAGLITVSCLAFLYKNWVIAEAAYVAVLLQLAFFAVRRFRKKASSAQPPVEFIWIPFALSFGAAGSLLISAATLEWLSPRWLTMGRLLAEQGFIFCIVVGIGGFMAPRLMGRTEILQPADFRNPEIVARIRQLKVIRFAALGLLLAMSFYLEFKQNLAAAYGLRAAIAVSVFSQNHAWPHWPKTNETFVRLLWLSIGMIVTGYCAAAIYPAARKGLLHLVFLGGYGLMIFAVATMVIISHAGNPNRLKKPLWPLRFAFTGILVALLARVSADFLPNSYFAHLASASVSMMLGSVLWIFGLLPFLTHLEGREDWEKCHEETKRQFLKEGGHDNP